MSGVPSLKRSRLVIAKLSSGFFPIFCSKGDLRSVVYFNMLIFSSMNSFSIPYSVLWELVMARFHKTRESLGLPAGVSSIPGERH
jgi:hypothetical protein